MNEEQWLTPVELSRRWQVPPSRLATWRYEGRGPAYVKLGGSVRYRLSDIVAFEERHTVGTGDVA